MTNPVEAIVAAYYPHVDACDFDWLLGIFAAQAVYQRADLRYDGIDAIAHFLGDERQIRGQHHIHRLLSDAPTRTVIATGLFDGKGAAGDARLAGFADIWVFNADHLVIERQTYLALGHDYVAR